MRIDKAGAAAWHDAFTKERIMPDDDTISLVLSSGNGRILIQGTP